MQSRLWSAQTTQKAIVCATKVVAPLLNLCPATLDQKDQHYDKQDSGNDPDESYTVHFILLSVI
jgi:hypothetical protein